MDKPRRPMITICGSDSTDTNLSKNTLEIAKQIGELIAIRKGIVVCGGRGGVMEAVAQGAKNNNGKTIGILPGNDITEANEYIDTAIPTDLGHKRNFCVVTAGQCIIALGGRWGTLNEISYGFIIKKPIVLLRNSGGVVDMLINSTFLKNYTENYVIVETAKEAVDKAFSLI
jgi:uncharacterized protein (TIGR00725 family)